ncbi:MAG: ferritin family protein [Syntrophobacteraceae bacterium]|nr:ferritin family protein [Desulfobacteraceae bacterium]
MLIVSCRSLDDVIAFAVLKEERSAEFYRECAQRARNPGIKEFFDEMAAQEQHHKELLQGLNSEDVSGVQLEKTEDLRISDYLMDSAFHPNITYQDALILAMKKEEKSRVFYSAWKNKCVSEAAAVLFEFLAAEEAKHKKRLETIYDEEILTWD